MNARHHHRRRRLDVLAIMEEPKETLSFMMLFVLSKRNKNIYIVSTTSTQLWTVKAKDSDLRIQRSPEELFKHVDL